MNKRKVIISYHNLPSEALEAFKERMKDEIVEITNIEHSKDVERKHGEDFVIIHWKYLKLTKHKGMHIYWFENKRLIEYVKH
jgi:hypothetical protein